MRRESAAGYPGLLRVKSVVLGDFEIAVPASPLLEQDVDVLWVATKATQLEQALELAPPHRVGDAAVVPLLNGVDHVELLRARYRNVVGAAIRVESERTAPGVIEQKSPFVRLDLAGAEDVVADLRGAGLDCRGRDDETTLLWEKLVFLAPVALATTAFDGSLGDVRGEPSFVACREEAAAAARAAGAAVDVEAIRALHEAAPPAMQSSMQKDVAAGREPELGAIAGPITRLGGEHGFSTAATAALVERVRARAH